MAAEGGAVDDFAAAVAGEEEAIEAEEDLWKGGREGRRGNAGGEMTVDMMRKYFCLTII